MRNEAVHTEDYKGHKIEIFQDENPVNPIQENDILGEWICWHKRYNLGNSKRFEKATPDEVKKYAEDTNSILIPLYMYEHSGIGLSFSRDHYPFNCPWDAGQLGYVLMDRKKFLDNYNKKIFTKKLRQKAMEIAQAELDEYNQYLQGDVYGYEVEIEEGKEGCWGIYGLKNAIEEAKRDVDCYVKQKVVK
jgi:hypothetical protein